MKSHILTKVRFFDKFDPEALIERRFTYLFIVKTTLQQISKLGKIAYAKNK